jgi:redox-sensitive bicupin YhaK (pirin superfamily)
MNKIIHRAKERGVAEHGWLHSRFSFSFADYYDLNKMGFGMLRVLNDDAIEPGTGFGTHPHNNMEIITIVQNGTLTHKDNLGSISTITPGEVQVMSAGTGILHSEYNHSDSEIVRLLQIWIVPKEKSIKPRYEQRYFEFDGNEENYITEIVSGKKNNQTLYIHQNASLSVGKLKPGKIKQYQNKFAGNGVYLFLLEGKIKIDENILESRDAIGITNTESFFVTAEENSEFIIIEVPMS